MRSVRFRIDAAKSPREIRTLLSTKTHQNSRSYQRDLALGPHPLHSNCTNTSMATSWNLRDATHRYRTCRLWVRDTQTNLASENDISASIRDRTWHCISNIDRENSLGAWGSKEIGPFVWVYKNRKMREGENAIKVKYCKIRHGTARRSLHRSNLVGSVYS